jgi:hypothetical protein
VLQFGDTAQSVLSALAPLVALLLVIALLGLLTQSRDAVEDVATLTVMLLCPLVLSFEIARRWGRAAQWYRFATAYCWSQWAYPLVLFAVLFGTSILMTAGLSENAAAGVGAVALIVYTFWLSWFVARHALEISGLRALALVVGVSVLTSVVTAAPMFADYAVNGAAADENGSASP